MLAEDLGRVAALVADALRELLDHVRVGPCLRAELVLDERHELGIAGLGRDLVHALDHPRHVLLELLALLRVEVALRDAHDRREQDEDRERIGVARRLGLIALHPDAEDRREAGHHHARERDDEANVQITAEEAAEEFPHGSVLQSWTRENAAITLGRTSAPVNDDSGSKTLQKAPDINRG